MSRIKGEDYVVDPNIPFSYFVELACQKITAMLYGMIRLRTIKIVFVYPSSKIICSSKIKHGKP